MKIVVVNWRDSNFYIEQCSKDSEFEFCTIKTVGFLVYADSDKLVLAQDIIEEDLRRVVVIPRENVISIETPKDI